MSRVAVGWGENTVGESAPSELASCFVGGTTSERVEKKRGSHGRGFRVAGPPCGSGSVDDEQFPPAPLGGRRTVTISRVKFPWPPFFRILIFFDEVFNSARGTTYLMRDDGATVVNVRP